MTPLNLLSRVCLAAATVLLTAPVAQSFPIVDLGYAQYQGSVNTANNITHFWGIRYAAPPLGDLRFRAPQPPVNMTGVQPATTQPNECFQAGSGKSPTNPLETRATQMVQTEDCLFLNNAAGTPPANLPTLVWIHGGGYHSGNIGKYNGEDIIRQSNRGVVVVLIQYLITGFLAGSEVKRNGALNAGLLDQDFALRWVNQHISKFGGDPSKVTIWGESAGAGSVLQHVIANGGQTEPQLFRAAITSSTFLPSQYLYNDSASEVVFFSAACTTAADSMACLRAVNGTALETANRNINRSGFYGTFLVAPVVDGDFITQRPTLSLMEGKVNGEALLAVTNTFEGTIFVNQEKKNASVTAAQYSLELFPGFSTAQANTVGTLYADLGSQQFQVNAVQGESIFICPTYYLLNAFPGRSFKGEFAIPPGLHGRDVPYYFSENPPFNNTKFIDAFAQSFTSFIVNLNPNIKIDPTTITPHWNKFDIRNTEMLFNKTPAGEPVVRPIQATNALVQRCRYVFAYDHRLFIIIKFPPRFWESVGNLTAQ
ncbi:Alpha/Beta hydrolase protein [Mycena leptocephala]|nr:Alpha/Beta hydrolase protein [Mycena leptocephala]